MSRSPRFRVGLFHAVIASLIVASTARVASAATGIWRSHGPGGASVRSLAVDPTNPSTLYAGTCKARKK
jgi:hypothetical protein